MYKITTGVLLTQIRGTAQHPPFSENPLHQNHPSHTLPLVHRVRRRLRIRSGRVPPPAPADVPRWDEPHQTPTAAPAHVSSGDPRQRSALGKPLNWQLAANESGSAKRGGRPLCQSSSSGTPPARTGDLCSCPHVTLELEQQQKVLGCHRRWGREGVSREPRARLPRTA